MAEPGVESSRAHPVEEELLRTRELLRTSIDCVPGWLALVDPDGVYRVANRRYAEFFGKHLDQIEGRLCWDVFPHLIAVHKPLFDRAVAGETVAVDDVLFENPARPTHIHGVYRPVFGPDGAVRFVSVLVLDITERVEAEEALRQSREQLAVTVRSIADGVLVADPEGRILLANPVAEELTGWSAAEAIGRPLDAVYRTLSSDDEGSAAPDQPGYRVLVHRKGPRTPVSERRSPLKDASGRTSGEVIVFRDVTVELRRREVAIKTQKLESLALLAGGIAHDFNNLLTGIQGNLSLALYGPGVTGETRVWLEDAEAASVRAQGLTRQLLTFARGGAPVRRVADLGPVLRQVASFSSLGSHVACRIDPDPDLWPAEVDEGQVSQVIQNLVLNAIEAMPDGGELAVSARNAELPPGNRSRLAPGPYVVLVVADGGAGMSEEVRARIFDPYFSTKQRRSGLGLAVTHSIVARHGGAIEVESEVGKGSTFQVFLPALPGALPEGAATGASGPARRGRVLVVDDDEYVRRLVGRTLIHQGHELAVAEDGRQALALFAEARAAGRPFDVVMLDLTIPGGMGGLETLASLRALDPGVRAIVMSGYSDNPVLADSAGHGFAAALAKPFDVAALKKCLGEVLGR